MHKTGRGRATGTIQTVSEEPHPTDSPHTTIVLKRIWDRFFLKMNNYRKEA